MFMLKVRNAFNPVRWSSILNMLKLRFNVPLYIRLIIGFYLSN